MMDHPTLGRQACSDLAERRRWGLVVSSVLCVALLALAITTARTYLGGYIGDFSHFYYAAKAVREGADPYAVHQRGYLYLPLLAIVMVPLTLLPIGAAGAVWAILNVSMLGGLLVLGLRDLSRRFASPSDHLAIGVAALVTLGVLLDKTRTELRLGQTDVLIALSLVLALRWLGRQQVLCGLCLAVVTSIKFQGVLFVAYLLVRRRFREAGWAAVWFVALNLVGALVFGWSKNLEYISSSLGGVRELVGQTDESRRQTLVFPLHWIRSVSVPSVLARLDQIANVGGVLIFGGTLLVALGLLAIGWRMYVRAGQSLFVGRGAPADDRTSRGRSIVALEWLGLATAALAFSPQTTSRHLFLLILPVMLGSMLLVEKREGVGRRALLLATIGLALGLVLPPGQEDVSPGAYEWRAIGGAMWCGLIYYFVVLRTGLAWLRADGESRARGVGV